MKSNSNELLTRDGQKSALGQEVGAGPITTDISITIKDAIKTVKSLLHRSENLKNQIFSSNKKKTVVTPKITHFQSAIKDTIISVDAESSAQGSSK